MNVLAQTPGVRRLRHRLRTGVSEHPAVYLPFARRKYPGPSPRVLDASTQMVLDGYTRSAGTYAVYVLQLAQEHPVRLAHHLHAPAQLMAAVGTGRPTVMVIREPRGAVLSQLVREPGVAMRDALLAYVRFHACLRPYRDGMVIADFDTVTHDFGAIIRRVNARFEMSLAAPTPAVIEEALAMIELRGRLDPQLLGFESGTVYRETARAAAARLRAGSPATDALRDAWVPSADRSGAKEALVRQWHRPALDRLRARAEWLYADFCSAEEVRRTTGPMHDGVAVERR